MTMSKKRLRELRLAIQAGEMHCALCGHVIVLTEEKLECGCFTITPERGLVYKRIPKISD